MLPLFTNKFDEKWPILGCFWGKIVDFWCFLVFLLDSF
uniref:Uncharacterized protein n=1 Tax=Siphoviridae sp. ctGpg14 TaxID=2827824 RepID=A0A8S5T5F9_9CAUD|nr:MAG TPA: hypothetical protein [Siphoviridae sp. ctGpg14]